MFPLIRKDERRLPGDYSGLVYTCDVDKTYLDTDFRSMKGLASIPFEWAEDKQTVAGMAPVLREMRFGAGPESGQTPFYFLTASPPFLTKALYRKMLLDSVQCDGMTCKDWKKILLIRRRPAWLKHQLPYKLCALMNQRTQLPSQAKEILIGDDMESDALAYAIYADLVSGKLEEEGLLSLLGREGLESEEIDEVLAAYEAVCSCPVGDWVEKIYIYLELKTPPEAFNRFGDDLVPCLSPFQMAVHLTLAGRTRRRAALQSARDLIKRGRATGESIAEQLSEGVRRGIFPATELGDLAAALTEADLMPAIESYPELELELSAPSRLKRGGSWLG